jgi:hypothetical protein
MQMQEKKSEIARRGRYRRSSIAASTKAGLIEAGDIRIDANEHRAEGTPRYRSPTATDKKNPTVKARGEPSSTGYDGAPHRKTVDEKQIHLEGKGFDATPRGWSSVSESAPARAPSASDTPKNGCPESTNGASRIAIAAVAFDRLTGPDRSTTPARRLKPAPAFHTPQRLPGFQSSRFSSRTMTRTANNLPARNIAQSLAENDAKGIPFRENGHPSTA